MYISCSIFYRFEHSWVQIKVEVFSIDIRRNFENGTKASSSVVNQTFLNSLRHLELLQACDVTGLAIFYNTKNTQSYFTNVFHTYGYHSWL